jgi:hypothetical protein
LNREIPPVIYHYTNDLGLRGILQEGKFWLTDIFNLNDPSELKHGISLLIKAFDDKIDTGHQECKYFAEWFKALVLGKGIQWTADYFVCSFSLCGDELGQWRAYADNGRGFALGFDTNILEDAFMDDGKTHNLDNGTFPVIYNDKQLAEIQIDLVERLLRHIPLRCMKVLNRDAFFEKLLFPLTHHSLYPTLHFKHEAYSNEKEYRFLQILPAVPPSEVKLRSRPYSLVRYREFDWRSVVAKALKKIVVGPAADKEKASHFAQDCLRAFHTESVELIYSGIPYRAT